GDHRDLHSFPTRRSSDLPDGALASVVREFEILSELESIGWTGVLAEATKHAPTQVVGEGGEFFTPCLLIAFACDNDQVFRTGQSTQVARNAECLVGIWINVQTGCPAVALGNLRPLQRILLSVNFLWILIAKGDTQAF